MTEEMMNKVELIAQAFSAWEKLENLREYCDEEVRISTYIDAAQGKIDTLIVALAQELVEMYRETGNKT